MQNMYNNVINTPCNVTPIVCPEKVVCTHCTYYYNQPVIVPVRTHVINHYVPQYTYQYQRTTTDASILTTY
jgi:hypothetical protein